MGHLSDVVAAYTPQGPQAWVSLLLVAFAVYSVQLVLRRLYFHPLSKIPGPFLARTTYWYEFYQDVILGGVYVKNYPALHEKYGPVIRASPDRVHVSDPDFFHEVYSSGSKYMKDPAFFQSSGGIPEALPAIVDVEYHRRRRRLINDLFSAKSMEALSHLVLKVVQNALKKCHEHHDERKVLDIQRLYTGITIDTIMRVLCDRTLNFIEATDEEPPFLATLRTFSESFFLLKHFPILIWMALNIPKRIAAKMIPGEFEFRANINQWIRDRAAEHNLGVGKASDGRKTVIDLLLLPEDGGKPLTYQAVEDETYSFAFAGTHTTSHTMSMGTYYLLSNPSKLQKLRDELKTVPKNDQGLYEYKTVRSLPYLNACIKESLRMSSPVPGILPRLVPDAGMTWKGHFLPGGTSVSSSVRSVHDNPDVFPDPAQFIPERWLGNNNLDHYLVVFGKGSRACIGLNVAWMETYLTFSNFFSSFDMSLYETNEATTDWTDCGNAMIKKHVRVKIDSIAV
ncbi:CND5p [Colletotrichum karsti]|uniref:CND5p n=1 Tax=Colletotrichum karsti TaxID=1095194 RepID=A0A9P6I3G2_9PEZI|nr:CND5p [Colletotrichum karsti]KAF9873291.1 CND5p [Colletotrichum karsti]